MFRVKKEGTINMKLTNNQIKVAKALKGNYLVNSGGGSGKTLSFTARIANLIANEKVAPQQILGLTFTNEAAESMKSKLREKVGKKADRVELSTFHSFAYRTLKSTYPEEYANKEIMKPWWKLNQIYDIIGKPSSKNPDGLGLEVRAGDLIGFFSYQKSNMVRGGDRVLIDETVSYVDHISEYFLQKAYDMYCERVKDARVIDFDDMLVDFYYKLLEDNELLARLRNRFEYIMVDEFQDTNTVNMAILQLISEDNLLVVGDFRQGIYGFINANIDNILEFHKNFNNVETIELEENFRSTNNIIQICNDVIDSSPNTKYKAFSEQKQGRNTPGKPIDVRVFSDETEETSHIVDEIERIYEESDLNYADFAILCRTNAQLGLYESFLANKGIPAKLSGGRSFFDRKEVSDLLAYAQHAINPEDNMSIRQIFNAPVRYIANTAINGLEKYSSQYDMPLEEAIGYYDAERYTSGFKRVVQDFENIRKHTGKRADVVLKKIYSIVNYENFIYSKSMSHTELVTKEEAVERLFEMASKFNTIQHFLAHVSVIKSNSKKDEDAVNVMTVHASKGLEYEHVFVAGVSEENYPHKMSTDYEEERRLLYVALSRAINELHISIPIFKGEDGESFEPSPFLIDIMEDDLFKAKREVIRGSRCSEFLYNSKRKKD